MRVRNVEIFRKKAKSYHGGAYYSDDFPPISLSSDTMLAPEKHNSAPKLTGANDIALDESIVEDDMETAPLEDNDENQTQQIRPPASSYPTCPHYRSLTSKSIAKLAFKKFIPNMKVVHCCSNGGEQSKMGVHDIEDLVSFGMMPQVLRNVAIYRCQAGTTQNGDAPFGILWKNGFREGKKVVVVEALVSEGEAEKEGSLSVGDVILKVNEKSVIGLSLKEVMDLIRTSKHVLLLDVVPPPGEIPQDDKVTYSEHSPCPYYLSQALAAKADLVFAPYNYILDPAIRSAMGINLANSVVILDEAHNIEDVLRESGSGKFTEIEMCEMVVFLSKYSNQEKNEHNVVEIYHPKAIDGKMHIVDVAHPLLVFVERLVQHLLGSKKDFVQNPGI
jgi:putative ubiquitin-RnfH superfamily antitoxin RatB of RatAB toxin-antitoxin module